MRWLKIIGITFLVFALLVVGGVVYVTNADLSRFKHVVEQAVSDATGRQFTIAGRFEPDIGLTSSLIVTDITFANADWSEAPAMVHADHFAVSIDLWSLIRQPVVVRNLEFRGARARLEVDGKGRANWELGPAEETDEAEDKRDFVPIVFEHVEVRDVEIMYRDQLAARKATLVIDELTEHPDEAGLLALGVKGRLNDRPIEVAGHIGPMNNLLSGKNVRQRLSGHIGGLQLELEGLIGELTTLSQPDLRFELHADELPELSEMFGFNPMGEGSLHARGRLAPAPEGVSMELAVELGSIQARATGTVDTFIDTKVLDVSVEASGPNLAPLDAIIKGLPAGAFNIAGRLQRRNATYRFDHVKARVGDNEASLNGTLGDLPRLAGTGLTFRVSGPDLSVFSNLAKTPLTTEPYVAEGRLEWQGGALKLTGVNAKVGENRLVLDGVLGSPPELIGTSLRIRAQGPDFSAIPMVVSYGDAPAEAFDVEGQLSIRSEHYEIEGLNATLGEFNLRAEGVVGLPPRIKGTDLQIEAGGPDLSRLTPYAGLDGLPAEPYSVRGRVRARKSNYFVDEMVVKIGSARMEINGEVAASAKLVGTDVEFRSSVPNLAMFEPIVAGLQLPRAPMKSSGRVRVRKDGYEFQQMSAQLSDATVRVEGILGRSSDLNGTDLKFNLVAPDLSLLAPFFTGTELPKENFSTTGQLRVTRTGYELRQTTARLGNAKIALRGTIGRPPELSGTDLKFDASAPNLSLIAPFAEDLKLPEQSFSTSGHVRVSKKGYEFSETTAELGDAKLRIDGTIGQLSNLTDSEISLLASGPNFAEIAAIANLAAPEEPFRIAARTERLQKGLRFHEASAKVGEHQLELTGLLGEPPTLVGTDLDFRAKGPDLHFISQLADLDHSLSDESFEIAGHFDGTPEAFRLKTFNARLGESDLAGSFDLDLRGKPDLEGEFSSEYFDLDTFLPEERSEPVTAKEGAESKPEGSAQGSTSDPEAKTRYLISKEPLDLSGLNAANVDIRFAGKQVLTNVAQLSNVKLGVRLRDGVLKLDPISARDGVGGSISGTASLMLFEKGFSVGINGTGEKLRLGLLSGKDEAPADQPPSDLVVVFEGRGNSLHEIAASGNGRIELVQGSGRINNSAIDLLATGVTLELVNAINPFRKKERHTTVECGVYGVEIVDGVARLDPFAARTDKMTLVGSGRIDLNTEIIDLVWNARPRKGIGISASAITNPYVRLGGTLSSPALGLKATEAALSAGAAVATGGLSILAMGVLDRLRAEEDVCKPALERLRNGTAGEAIGKELPPN